MDSRKVDADITLVPYYSNEDVALKWYQDKEVCKQVDNIDYIYSLDRLKAMYRIAIVICKEYQNQHIGRRCVLNMIKLAKEKGMNEVKANIYAFNKQSQAMFQSIGFHPSKDEWYVYNIEQKES